MERHTSYSLETVERIMRDVAREMGGTFAESAAAPKDKPKVEVTTPRNERFSIYFDKESPQVDCFIKLCARFMLEQVKDMIVVTGTAHRGPVNQIGPTAIAIEGLDELRPPNLN